MHRDNENNKVFIKGLCDEGINRINEVLKNMNGGSFYKGIHINGLINTKEELTKMKEVLDKKNYSPSYPKFLLDYPVESELLDYLIHIAYEYKKKL